MPSYTFKIRKADHPCADRGADLHVHVHYNEGKSRILLGRYRLPTLEPIFSRERELNKREQQMLREWLSKPEQVRKLQSCLEDTIFDMHRVLQFSPQFGQVMVQGGETYINIRIPVSRRLA